MDWTGDQMTLEITITQLTRAMRTLPLDDEKIVTYPGKGHPAAKDLDSSNRAFLNLSRLDPLQLYPCGTCPGLLRRGWWRRGWR